MVDTENSVRPYYAEISYIAFCRVNWCRFLAIEPINP